MVSMLPVVTCTAVPGRGRAFACVGSDSRATGAVGRNTRPVSDASCIRTRVQAAAVHRAQRTATDRGTANTTNDFANTTTILRSASRLARRFGAGSCILGGERLLFGRVVCVVAWQCAGCYMYMLHVHVHVHVSERHGERDTGVPAQSVWQKGDATKCNNS